MKMQEAAAGIFIREVVQQGNRRREVLLVREPESGLMYFPRVEIEHLRDANSALKEKFGPLFDGNEPEYWYNVCGFSRISHNQVCVHYFIIRSSNLADEPLPSSKWLSEPLRLNGQLMPMARRVAEDLARQRYL